MACGCRCLVLIAGFGLCCVSGLVFCGEPLLGCGSVVLLVVLLWFCCGCVRIIPAMCWRVLL